MNAGAHSGKRRPAPASSPGRPVTTGLLLTVAVFILAACFGYYLGGSTASSLRPFRPGGPEVRVELVRGPCRQFDLQVQGDYAWTDGSGRVDLGTVPLRPGHANGIVRVTPTARGLQIFRPDGPRQGDVGSDRFRIQGPALRQPRKKEPIWGAIEVRRVGEDRLAVVQVLDMETYLQGVLLPEMGPDFPLEALKAQAVAARSYAFARLRSSSGSGNRTVLKRTDLDQVFRPVARVPTVIQRAVDETRGQVLGSADRPLTAYYHSTCGGATRDAAPAFDPRSPIHGRTCTFCRGSRFSRWERSYDITRLTRLLVDRVSGITPPVSSLHLEHDAHGYTTAVVVTHGGGNTSLPGDRFRALVNQHLAKNRSEQLLGLRLSSMVLSADSTCLRITGHGWGHGVGMCQMGAARLARQGWNYRQILAFYYGEQPLVRAWGHPR